MANTHAIIETVEVTGSGQSSISFSSIPQGFTDLKIVLVSRNDVATEGGRLTIAINGVGLQREYMLVNNTSLSGGTTLYDAYVNGGTSTANLFSSTDIYIPSYTTTDRYKMVSINSFTQNESSGTGFLMFSDAVRADNAAVESITLNQNGSNWVSGTIATLYGISAGNSGSLTIPKATGGAAILYDGYWYHAFTGSGDFVPLEALTCDYLVVGGGGGANPYLTSGENAQNGAGGGGVNYNSAISLTVGTYPVVVGAGGGLGSTGGTSSFNGVSATGGTSSITAGSGGGAGGAADGGSGSNGPSTYSTFALATPTGEVVAGVGYYAGGGGAGGLYSHYGYGGNGGGGNGAGSSYVAIAYSEGGARNSGGGGGGGQNGGGARQSSGGGSGVVIVRYAA